MREVADRFIEGVVAGAKALRVGDPMELDHRGRADGLAASSSSSCASSWTTPWRTAPTLRCGGPVRAAELPGADFFAPAVLTGVTHDMRIMREEIFGPVVPIVTVDSRGRGDRPGQRLRVRPGRVGVDARPRARASGSRAGIEAGMVWINDHMYSHGACSCSWGGVKDSGLGRSHSKFGFYECVNVKLLTLGAVAHARLLVAPLRRVARPRPARVGPAPLRARRGQAGAR